MDLIAATYDYNNNALRRVNELVKNAPDPNGIMFPISRAEVSDIQLQTLIGYLVKEAGQ